MPMDSKLIAQDKKPALKILEECSVDDWKQREVFWIEFYRTEGCELTNCKEGGNGSSPTAESRLKMSVAKKGRTPHNKGKCHTDDTKAKQRESALLRWQKMPADERNQYMSRISAIQADMSRGKPGRKKSEEEKAKISAALLGNNYTRGYKASDETKAKLSQARMGHSVSEETRQKISKSNSGKIRTPEMIERLSLSHKGQLPTEATKIKRLNTRERNKAAKLINDKE